MNVDAALPALIGESRVLAVYLLGSANSGGMRADSDVDLALLAHHQQ